MNKTCKDCAAFGKCWTDCYANEEICSYFQPKIEDAVDPDHYKHGGIERKDCIKAALGENYIGFLLGNVMKYVYRYKCKNGAEDLKKAAVYLGWAIQELEGKTEVENSEN